jgi:hypothetical protein
VTDGNGMDQPIRQGANLAGKTLIRLVRKVLRVSSEQCRIS